MAIFVLVVASFLHGIFCTIRLYSSVTLVNKDDGCGDNKDEDEVDDNEEYDYDNSSPWCSWQYAGTTHMCIFGYSAEDRIFLIDNNNYSRKNF